MCQLKRESGAVLLGGWHELAQVVGSVAML
jgi:hypothetical protein